jgi:hypothetical protein
MKTNKIYKVPDGDEEIVEPPEPPKPPKPIKQ